MLYKIYIILKNIKFILDLNELSLSKANNIKTAVIHSDEVLNSPSNALIQSNLHIDSSNDPLCTSQQIIRFLKTTDFELYAHDDARVEKVTFSECLDLCSSNIVTKVCFIGIQQLYNKIFYFFNYF